MKTTIQGLLALAIAGAGTSAYADELASNSATPLPKMTVTVFGDREYAATNASAGTKTDTPLMETPLAIQVIPQQVLQDQKVTTLDQALGNVSGVRSKNLGGAQENIYLRGFLSTTTFRNGFRIDDDYGFGLRSMTNVDSVEVLKGPGAILYGRVEPGGIVNVITKQPQATPQYSIEQQVGSWDRYQTALGATGAVNDATTVLYRFDASYERMHSWRESVQSEKLFIAPSVRWDISPRTQVNVEAEYTYNPMVWDSGQVVPVDPSTGAIVWLPRTQNLTASKPARGDTTFVGINWSHAFNDHWTVRHQINRHEFRQFPDPYFWVLAFNQTDGTWTVDRALQNTDGRWTTTATVLDLTGKFDTASLRHTLLLGADYYHRAKSLFAQNSSVASTTSAFDPTPPVAEFDPAAAYSQDATTNNLGVYVQDQINLPHAVSVLAGFRYQRVTQNSGFTDSTGTRTPDTPQSDSATTPRVGLLWRPREQLSLYGNYAENFGANNGLYNADWLGNPLTAQSARQYEIGAKGQLDGGRLTASIALFELTKRNVPAADIQHIGQTPFCTPGCSVAVGEIRSRGPEIDLQGEVLPGWNIVAAYTYTDIVVTKSTPGSEYTLGNRMANVPKSMASLWNTYEFRGGRFGGWKVGGGVTAYSSATDPTNTIPTPGYAVVNAMASFEFETGGKRVTGQLNLNNLLNRTYYTDLAASYGVGYLQYGAPRSALVSLSVEL